MRWLWRAARRLVLALAVAALAAVGLTSALDGWGTVAGERTRILPGDARTRAPQLDLTQAIALRAAPEDVWPWLVQLGQGRGGFYSYAWLENLIGSDIHNAERIEPRWQDLEVGDAIRLHPRMPAAYRVAELDAPRDLLLVVGEAPQPVSTWLFHLERQPDGTTRLLARLRVEHPRTVAQWLTWDVVTAPASLVMQRRMLLGLRERVERTPASKPPAQQKAAVTTESRLTTPELPWPTRA